MAIAELTQVSKIYEEGHSRVEAVRGVDLRIEAGEFTAIAGPSGSGKSTLLNLVGALDVPTSGRIRVVDRDLNEMSGAELSTLRRNQIGFVFQSYNLIPVLSAVENVEFIMMVQGVPARQRRQRALAMLEKVGLADLARRRPIDMSGGQQQRVAVARAIVGQPDLVLADEPTANLDSKTGAALMDLMQRMNEDEHMTFVFSSHDPMVLERSRRLLLLHDGEIVEDRPQPHVA
jgi:putative ABC transport system ATP-binding protein